MNDATEFRTVTYRLHPGTRARHRKLVRIAGACRYVWNRVLACNRRDYATYKLRKALLNAGLVVDEPSPPPVSFQSMGVRFTALRRETPWLQRLPYAPVRYVLKYQAQERLQPPQSGPPPPRPHATANRHDTPSLAPRDKPNSRQHRRTARHRGPEDEGHDPIRQGVGRASGQARQAESGTQPGNPEHRLVAIATDAQVQGGARRSGSAHVHQPDVQGLRHGRSGEPQVSIRIRVCPLRTQGQRGRECRVEYHGVGDRRGWTARSVGAGHSDEPSTCIRTEGGMSRQPMYISPKKDD